MRATAPAPSSADDVEREVGPVEPGANRRPLAQPEPRSDLIGHTRRGGRGGSHHRRPSERGDRIVQAQVVRPEVVAPLGDAVGLVDDEQRHAPLRQSLAERAGGEPLGRRKHELVLTGGDRAQRRCVVPIGHAGGEHRGGHAGLLQAAQLVGHQRDQRADDDDGTVAGQRGQLVAQATCRRRWASPPGCRAP